MKPSLQSIGGQAVLEGVMLRKKAGYAIAVRTPKGIVKTIYRRIKDNRTGWLSFLRLPFFRGMYAMYEMLLIGTKSLIWSGNIAEGASEPMSKKEIFWVVTISLLFTLGIFVVLPYVLTMLLGVKEQANPVWFNIIDSVIKILLFLGYIIAISRMEEIKRVFQYHGAEHKVVHCYEHQKPLTVKNVQSFSRIHPRCGTSFIVYTIIISIIVFTFLPIALQQPWFLQLAGWQQIMVLGGLRILILPLIVGISYEVLKLAAKYPHNPLLKAIATPGLWLQRLTTSEPSAQQVRIGIASLKALKV